MHEWMKSNAPTLPWLKQYFILCCMYVHMSRTARLPLAVRGDRSNCFHSSLSAAWSLHRLALGEDQGSKHKDMGYINDSEVDNDNDATYTLLRPTDLCIQRWGPASE